MRPTDYPFDLNTLTATWHAYTRGGPKAAAEQAAQEIDPLVLASWRRCRARLDPHDAALPVRLSSSALDAVLAQRSDLVTMALPVLEDVCDFSAEGHLVAVVTDRSGCMLAVETRGNGDRLAREIGMTIGRFWSEEQVGTCAIALALSTAMPVQVVGPEHYARRLHAISTVAAPLHAAGGQVIGAIGFACRVEHTTYQDLPLVMSTARAIGSQIQTDSFVNETFQQLTQLNAILGSVTEGVLMWDENGRVHHCNRQVATLFGVSEASLLGKPWDAVLQWPSSLVKAVEQQRSIARAETTLRIRNRRANCLVTLRPIRRGNAHASGYVALFRPIRQVRRLVHEQVGSEATFQLDDLVSHTPQMQRIVRQARVAARGSIPVLLIGESGVGKTFLAQAIHNGGPRAGRPFVSLNCRAIPHERMTAELLGVERDASHSGRPSKFELADGGTLMFNQLHYLTLDLQAMLLEVIDRRQLLRPGHEHPITVSVRIVATLPPNADELVADGSLLPELYVRFGVFRFEVPSLRERLDDLPLLVDGILARLSADAAAPTQIDDDALAALARYPWPGNVRELESVLERALAHAGGDRIGILHLPESVRTGRVLIDTSPLPRPVLTVDEAEREAILRAGVACNGIVTQMARELGIGRTTLWRKMKRFNISPAQFK